MRSPMLALCCLVATNAFAQVPASSGGATVSSQAPVVSADTPSAVPLEANDASDQALLDALMTTLSADASLKGAYLTVVVDRGNVNLSGSTLDGAQAARARSDAAIFPGVRTVSSTIVPER
jgi:osmotically-inducible protein OsmY